MAHRFLRKGRFRGDPGNHRAVQVPRQIPRSRTRRTDPSVDRAKTTRDRLAPRPFARLALATPRNSSLAPGYALRGGRSRGPLGVTKTIHLVFKTHLDIGFSNLAEQVRHEYHQHFIPEALTTAEHFFREDPLHPK